MKRLFENVFKLELPPKLKVHLAFHISLLKLYHEDTLMLISKQVLRCALELVDDHLDYKVEGILKNRNTKKGLKILR